MASVGNLDRISEGRPLIAGMMIERDGGVS